MKSLNKVQLASIAAATVLVAYIGVAASLQASQAPKEVDWPAILTANAASVDYFLKVDGIAGESTDERHKGEIEILSYSLGTASGGSVAPGGGGRVQMQDFHFSMVMNKASPLLFQKCVTGEHISEVVLTARKAGADQQDYLTIKFTDVIVSSYTTSGTGDVPIDNVSFSFAKLDIEYKPQNPDGTPGVPVTATWDSKLVKKL